MESKVLSQQELRRYQKLMAIKDIGQNGQENLKQASILVVGAGGLGAPVLQYLTAIGVGTIGIMDNDMIEERNLPGQILYGSHDLGKLKAIIAKQKLQELNHLVNFNVHNICLSKDNALGFCQEYDIIVDCTDNFHAKYLINDACVILKKKWIYASFNNFEGSFSVFDGKEGPTLRCLFPSRPSSDENILPGSGELGVLTGVIGSFQANEVIKILTGFGKVFQGELLSFNLQDNKFVTSTIQTNPDNLELVSMS